MDLNLKGKNAITSGGNKGLGAASAMALAAEGANGVEVGLLAIDITDEGAGELDEVARVVTFLASDALGNVNDTVLAVDGGMTKGLF